MLYLTLGRENKAYHLENMKIKLIIILKGMLFYEQRSYEKRSNGCILIRQDLIKPQADYIKR